MKSNMFVEDQKFRYDQAVEQYLAQTRILSHVIGIIVSGSYVHGQLGPHSDVDIFVITDPSSTERERGNTWIDGVLAAAIDAEDFSSQVAALRKLLDFVEALLGGKRPKEWVLQSRLDCVSYY